MRMRYASTAAKLEEAGAVHAIFTKLLVTVVVGAAGADGGAAATIATSADSGPNPWMFSALILNLYSVPPVNPVLV